jgi:glucose-1-phosphate thymidylyltransferase
MDCNVKLENERLCLEKYARRCCVCGCNNDVVVRQINRKDGNVGYYLSNLILLCEQCNIEADKIKNNYRENVVGVLLCGGKGSRLYPLTLRFNKHLLPLALSHMVSYPIRTLRSFGIKKVIIIIDRDSGSDIISILGSGGAYGMDFSYKVQEGAQGISDALYLTKNLVSENDRIVCILGDNVFDDGAIDTNIDFNDDMAYIWVKKVDRPEDYGVVTLEGDRITKITEKPQNPDSNLAVVGLYSYNYDVFSIIEKTKPSKRGELEISSVNDFYVKSGKLQYHMVNGYWADCGGSIQKYCEASLHGAKKAKVSAEEIDNFRSIVFDDK